MADVSKVNVNSTDYNIKDSNAMHKGVDRVTAGQSIIAPIGTASTADGFAVNASGDYSHASGLHTIAASDVQHVIGKYNEEDANGTYPFIIGGGRLDFDRKNIFTVDWNGVARDGTQNRLMPFKAVSEAEYAALSQAEKTNGTAYFRYEANGVMREIQDNGSATSLTSGALPTGQTIESYLNSKMVKIQTIQATLSTNSYVAPFRSYGEVNISNYVSNVSKVVAATVVQQSDSINPVTVNISTLSNKVYLRFYGVVNTSNTCTAMLAYYL